MACLLTYQCDQMAFIVIIICTFAAVKNRIAQLCLKFTKVCN